MIDLNRLNKFECNLLYENGTDTGAIITNYTPATPSTFRQGVKTVHGYTYFQKNKKKSDCTINFTIAFQIKGRSETETKNNINKFLNFRNNYQERFIFVDEFNTKYKGYIQNRYDIKTPIEGDIYYIDVTLLCNHDVSGWVKDNERI